MNKFKVGDRVLVPAVVKRVERPGGEFPQYGCVVGGFATPVWYNADAITPAPATPPTPTGKTVKVRAAVCVADDGRWVVIGYSTDKDDAERIAGGKDCIPLDAEGNYPKHDVIHFIEAEVPVPEPQTIPGKVEPSDG